MILGTATSAAGLHFPHDPARPPLARRRDAAPAPARRPAAWCAAAFPCDPGCSRSPRWPPRGSRESTGSSPPAAPPRLRESPARNRGCSGCRPRASRRWTGRRPPRRRCSRASGRAASEAVLGVVRVLVLVHQHVAEPGGVALPASGSSSSRSRRRWPAGRRNRTAFERARSRSYAGYTRAVALAARSKAEAAYSSADTSAFLASEIRARTRFGDQRCVSRSTSSMARLIALSESSSA